MESIDENIKVLSRAVLSDAQRDTEQVLDEAKKKADGIRQRAQEQADAERKKILDQASKEAERIRGQVIATSQMKARTMQLEQREKLLEKVFETAQGKLAAMQSSSDYEKVAQRLLREALMQLGSSTAQVRADETTQKFFTSSELEKMSKELNIAIRFGEPLKRGLGVIVETQDGHRQFDNTLETRLRRMKETLRSPVYHILMGEAL
jgi:V/A-type H+/Na+-transporting ATPase subunit E